MQQTITDVKVLLAQIDTAAINGPHGVKALTDQIRVLLDEGAETDGGEDVAAGEQEEMKTAGQGNVSAGPAAGEETAADVVETVAAGVDGALDIAQDVAETVDTGKKK